MSAKKSADSGNALEPSQIVVGGGKSKTSGLRSRLPLIVGVVVLLTLLGVGGWLLYQKSSDSKSKEAANVDTHSSKVPAEAAKMTEINGQKVTAIQRSQQAIFYGDYDKGQQILKDLLASAKTDNDKIVLYMQLGSNALNAQKYTEADNYALEIIKIKPTPAAYSLLASSAAAQGKKEQAIDYANQQKKLLDPKASSYERQVDDINKFIEEQK